MQVFTHQSVLPKEVIAYLNPQSNENFVDCTLGGGGHAREILQKNGPSGQLLGIDLDPEAIKAAGENLKDFGSRVKLVNDNFKNIKEIAYGAGFNKINGILLDLGLSSFELQDSTRGFSFMGSALLDMRFGQTGQTAADILNNYKEEHLTKIFRDYGEERFARQIAKEIVISRQEKPLKKTDQLVQIIENVYKNKPKPKRIHVATKVFQALRIEVNDELNNLKQVLTEAVDILDPDGRIVVISFHSLEDRIVKQFFKREAKECLCPPKLPICQCGHHARLKLLTKKIVLPAADEIQNNPRSRSAKLRAAQKII